MLTRARTRMQTKPERISETDGIDGDITKVGDRFHLFYGLGGQGKTWRWRRTILVAGVYKWNFAGRI